MDVVWALDCDPLEADSTVADVDAEPEGEVEAEAPFERRVILACSRGIRSTGARVGLLSNVLSTGTESNGEESIVGGMTADSSC